MHLWDISEAKHKEKSQMWDILYIAQEEWRYGMLHLVICEYENPDVCLFHLSLYSLIPFSNSVKECS
jgi:hypothetical protein